MTHHLINTWQLSGGVCALGGEPSTMPDQQAPVQLKVNTSKVAQAGGLVKQLDRLAKVLSQQNLDFKQTHDRDLFAVDGCA
ncbi:unnamed protein product [Lupinus luteus]|uniref:Uncharacterized protein n=1 Tax=Lupinus luteus TaxID=3873 RepID=A0AAV1VS44_LUPLU